MTNQPGPARPRARKRTWLLVPAGVVVLCAVLWSAVGAPGWERGTRPESPPIPDPNGYDDVLEAGRAVEKSGLTGPKFDLEKADQAALEPVVLGCSEAIARARRGLEKPFQVPVVYDLKSMTTVLLRDLGSIRGGLVRGLIAEGRLNELEGRADEGADSYADVIRLGGAMSHRVPMLAYLMAAAVQGTGIRHVRDVRTKLSPEASRKMIGLLEESDRDREPARDVVVRETQFMNMNLKRLGFVAAIAMRVTGKHAKGLDQVASSLAISEDRLNATRRLLLTDLALRMYRQEHGEDPPGLDALVPAILNSVPVDPYTGKPLRYQKHGKDGTVYSVGPDRDDDRLGKTLVQRHNHTTDGDFTIDSF